MENKKIGIILICLTFIIGIFISGCENTSNENIKANSFGLDQAFSGGNKALTIELTKGQPPEKIRDGGLQPFNIRAIIKNEGEYTIPEGKAHLVITGIKPEDFNIKNPSKSLPEMKGISKQGEHIIKGSITPVIFSGLKYNPELVSGAMTQKLILDICYPYQTKSLIVLCVSGNTLQESEDNLKICSVESNRPYASSGAPVVIENVKEMPAGEHKIAFQFDIIHKKSDSNNGRVYKLGSLDENCKVQGNSISSSEAKISEDYVHYKVETKIPGLDCSGNNSNEGEILLQDGKATVYCTQDVTGQEDYEKPIKITLSYDYFDRITKDITIEHISK